MVYDHETAGAAPGTRLIRIKTEYFFAEWVKARNGKSFLFKHSWGCGTHPRERAVVRLKEKRGGEDNTNYVNCNGVRYDIGTNH